MLSSLIIIEDHVWYVGSLALFFSLSGTYLTHPFSQMQRDAVDCDTLCFGYLQSAKAAFYLVAAIFVGHMSDKYGRHSTLYFGLAGSILSFGLTISNDSIAMMLLSLLPASFNQIPAGMKSLFSDYSLSGSVTDTDRAAYMGYIGMAAGLSYMIGPYVGSILFTTHKQAFMGSIVFNIIAIALVFCLPERKPAHGSPDIPTQPLSCVAPVPVETSISHTIQQSFSRVKGIFVHILAMESSGAKMLLTIRFLMGLAYSVYTTSFTASLKHRFSFGPADYGMYMGWVGFSYSISQGVLTKPLVRRFGRDTVLLLLICSFFLGTGRILVMETTSLVVVYVTMFLVITALGVMNTVMTTACSSVAGSGGNIGALFGAMEAVEKVAGLLGPSLGGMLHKTNYRLPALAVCIIYIIIFSSIALLYEKLVIRPNLRTLMSSWKDDGEDDNSNKKTN
jgi:MFS transporter, DHA1 family, tetracycline resistance protein